MDQGDNDCIIPEGEDLPPPAEPEEQALFTFGDRDIFEDDPPPVPTSPSLYGMSQLMWDVNSSPSQEDT